MKLSEMKPPEMKPAVNTMSTHVKTDSANLTVSPIKQYVFK